MSDWMCPFCNIEMIESKEIPGFIECPKCEAALWDCGDEND